MGNETAIASLRRKLSRTTEPTKRLEIERQLSALGYVEKPAEKEKPKAAPEERHPAEHKTTDAPTTKRGPGRPRREGSK